MSDDPRDAIASAQQAEEQRDWALAGQRWAVVRDRFPAELIGYLGGARALRETGDLDEAAALLRGSDRFAGHAAVLHDLGRVAEAREDWLEAETCWRQSIATDPNPWWAYTGLANALRRQERWEEAEAVLLAAQVRMPDEFILFADHARLASARRDWATARQRWEDVRQRFPNNVAGYSDGAATLREMDRPDEAHALLTAAIELFPGDGRLLHDLGRLAEARGDWLEAETCWRQYIAIDPNPWWAYAGLANALRRQERWEEAEAILLSSFATFPQEAGLFIEYARWAEIRCDWTRALERWNETCIRFPNIQDAWLSRAIVLRELGRVAESSAVLVAGLESWPADVAMTSTLADNAITCGDLDLAVRTLVQGIEKNPNNRHLASHYINTLLSMDLRQEAVAALDVALRTWPTDAEFRLRRMELALRMTRFDEAYACFRDTLDQAGNHSLALDFAIRILRADPPKEIALPIMRCLAQEKDSGERDWGPKLSYAVDLFYQEGDRVRAMMAEYLMQAPIDTMDPGTRIVLQTFAGVKMDATDVDLVFEQWLVLGRIALTSTVFSTLACNLVPERRAAAETFNQFIDKKLADSDWPRYESLMSLVSHLMFASVFSLAAYHRIVAAARRNIELDQLIYNHPTGTNAVLVDILTLAADFGPNDALDASTIDNASPARPALIAGTRDHLRIALEVSGQLRGYKQAGATWTNLGLAGHEVTTFVSSWNEIGRNWARAWDLLRPYGNLWDLVSGTNGLLFLQNHFPKLGTALAQALQGSTEADVASLQEFYDTEHVVLEDDRLGAFRGRQSVWKMHYKMEQAHRQACNAKKEFDLFIRIRPDHSIGPNSNIDWQHLSWLSIRNNGLALDIPFEFIGKPGYLKLGDAFAAGVKGPMNVFTDTLGWQTRIAQTGRTLLEGPVELANHVSPAFAVFCQGVTAWRIGGINFGGFLNPPILPYSEIIKLLLEDIGGTPRNDLERDFLSACLEAYSKGIN